MGSFIDFGGLDYCNFSFNFMLFAFIVCLASYAQMFMNFPFLSFPLFLVLLFYKHCLMNPRYLNSI